MTRTLSIRRDGDNFIVTATDIDTKTRVRLPLDREHTERLVDDLHALVNGDRRDVILRIDDK